MPRTISNPPNPWLSRQVEWLDEPSSAEVVVYEVEAKSLLSENSSDGLSIRFSP